jgi:hypothetical protein
LKHTVKLFSTHYRYITAQFIVCRRGDGVKAVALAEVATPAHPERCAATLGATRVRTYIWAVSTSPTCRAHTSPNWLPIPATGENLQSEPVFGLSTERGGLLTLALPPPGASGSAGNIPGGPPCVLISSIRHPCGTLRMRICNLRISHSCCACCPLPIARNRSQQVAVMLIERTGARASSRLLAKACDAACSRLGPLTARPRLHSPGARCRRPRHPLVVCFVAGQGRRGSPVAFSATGLRVIPERVHAHMCTHTGSRCSLLVAALSPLSSLVSCSLVGSRR